ncbi:metalloregulator ArsR/SmtB family transcription factor [uncultured Sulfitobacter sp.]|uniref:ArsR/SmtB family transcription factor n=1 Tax=uncultured Sulfitobacter sp. TaxID=191468 RepID=UPI0026256131|nr:metalloregulator ArsR/SmtB family transcription factor [uncultured Sulfitobacter sp.]
MQQETAIAAFSALAHPTRLAVFRLLVACAPDAVPALTIAARLEAKPSTLSGHLAILKRADLVASTRHQREIRYEANLQTVNSLVGFLLSDCCGGRLSRCQDILTMLSD